MTRETAFRRMLAGTKVQHPDYEGMYFAWDAKAEEPLYAQQKQDSENGCVFFDVYFAFVSRKTGWKEYR